MPELIDEASRLALVGATERGVRAEYELAPEADLVLADRVQIQQVLVNLIRNAIEAMSDSAVRTIVVSTRLEGRQMVRISVSDTGPGLAQLVQERLFEAFTSTKERGMGLGLSICRTIVEAHGGRIWADTRPGGGTIFNFTIMKGRKNERKSSGHPCRR